MHMGKYVNININSLKCEKGGSECIKSRNAIEIKLISDFGHYEYEICYAASR